MNTLHRIGKKNETYDVSIPCAASLSNLINPEFIARLTKEETGKILLKLSGL